MGGDRQDLPSLPILPEVAVSSGRASSSENTSEVYRMDALYRGALHLSVSVPVRLCHVCGLRDRIGPAGRKRLV